jgi:hypothetical protein
VQPHIVAPEAGTIGKAIDRAADARPILANDARLLIDGPECYAAMLEIHRARQTLDPLRELHHSLRQDRVALRRGPCRPGP